MPDIFTLRFLHGSRTKILAWAGGLIALIGVVDWYFQNDVSFGFLYLFPMLMVGACLTRLQIAAIAALCTGLTEAFDPFIWALPVGLSRVILTFAAFSGVGFYSFALARNRRLADRHLGQIEKEIELRRSTEEQLEFLISSSPAAILTLDSNGSVLLANAAAHRLFGVDPGLLQGQSISQFVPALASVPSSTLEAPVFHTQMECRGRSQDGEVFVAQVWFSTYQTNSGPRLAAIVFDASEEFRDRAEFNLQQILTGSKVLVGALCHEIRNVCGAIGAVHAKLARNREMQANEDFRALGTLVLGLERMAGLELRQTTQAVAQSVDLRSVLEELRIVIEPSFHEAGMSIRWESADLAPRVWADRQTLLQAFLNIAKNSERAMSTQARREMVVRTSIDGDRLVVRFIDSGSGVSHPEQLFEPFQPGAQASGLGLYLSRTFVRAFNGDLQYEPRSPGCCFAVFLARASDHEVEMEKTA
jgi:PAS domain S-box-containing protein